MGFIFNAKIIVGFRDGTAQLFVGWFKLLTLQCQRGMIMSGVGSDPAHEGSFDD